MSVYSCKRQSHFSNDKKIICFRLSKENYINVALVSTNRKHKKVIPIYSIEVLHFVSLEENVANVAVLEIMRPL